MSGNKFQIKRTGVAGRQPNTSNSSNSSYIDVGELALNFTDGILYSSNGSTLLELGANVTNQTITGSLTANGSVGSDGQVLISNGSGIYWSDFEAVGGLVSITTDDTFAGTGTAEDPLRINSGELTIETRTANSVVVQLTDKIANFLRIDKETFRNPAAIVFTKNDEPVFILLN